jgi:hypothetical protein
MDQSQSRRYSVDQYHQVDSLAPYPAYSEPEHADPGLFWPSCDESWWDPPDSMEGAFFKQDGEDSFVIAKCHGGRVYFAAVCW